MNVHLEPGFTAVQSHLILQMFPWHWKGSLSCKQTCRCQLGLPTGHSQRPELGPRGKGTQDPHLLPALSGSSSTPELSLSFLDKRPQGPSQGCVHPAYSSSAVPCGLWGVIQNPPCFGPCWPFQLHQLPALSLTCTPSAELSTVSWAPCSLPHSCVFAQGAALALNVCPCLPRAVSVALQHLTATLGTLSWGVCRAHFLPSLLGWGPSKPTSIQCIAHPCPVAPVKSLRKWILA